MRGSFSGLVGGGIWCALTAGLVPHRCDWRGGGDGSAFFRWVWVWFGAGSAVGPRCCGGVFLAGVGASLVGCRIRGGGCVFGRLFPWGLWSFAGVAVLLFFRFLFTAVGGIFSVVYVFHLFSSGGVFPPLSGGGRGVFILHSLGIRCFCFIGSM